MNYFLLYAISLFIFTNTQAQCYGRYQQEIFDRASITTVTYSDVYDLDMDIYQPIGDVEANRPLLILAHGGSFVGGTRTNATVVSLAETFAKRGYVVASISYRLMKFSDFLTRSATFNGVAEALSDGKAAVRYFRKTVDEGNVYRIDPNQIYFGGNSAGGVIALHTTFIQEEEVIDPDLLTALNNNGGIEGNSGNEGYSSEVKGVISLAGGIVDVNLITESDLDKLLISCHGDEDNTIPYNCGQPLSEYADLINSYGLDFSLTNLCGGGAILEHSVGIDFNKHHHLVFEGAGHAPWESNNSSKSVMIRFASEHLYNDLDCVNVGGENQKPYIFPNPTESTFIVQSLSRIDNIIVSNLNGKVIYRAKNHSRVNIKHLPQGVYVIEIHDENQKITHAKVIKM
ncbi:MAG: T9SS type A sorting domain-containing protein [Flavobacteriales bacterium]|nr:T9SS type A sorting domain-containing protein [Flavobacteriales bacterium]